MNHAKKLLGTATATALLASGFTLTTMPAAEAAIAAPTVSKLSAEKRIGEYGANLGLYLNSTTTTAAPVNGSDRVWAGTAHLQMKPKGSSTWKTIASDASPGYQYFDNVKFTGNATYRVYYQGTFYDDYPEDVTYGDSYSNEVVIKTTRTLTVKNISKGGTLRGQFKATPKFGGKKFVFHKKVGKKWKKYKTVKANTKGVAKVTFAAKRGKKTFYRVTVPGNSQFTKNVQKFTAYRY